MTYQNEDGVSECMTCREAGRSALSKHQRIAGIEPYNLIKKPEPANDRSHNLHPHRDEEQQLFYEKRLRFRGNANFTFLRKFSDMLKNYSYPRYLHGKKKFSLPFLLCVTRRVTRELMFVYLDKTKKTYTQLQKRWHRKMKKMEKAKN